MGIPARAEVAAILVVTRVSARASGLRRSSRVRLAAEGVRLAAGAGLRNRGAGRDARTGIRAVRVAALGPVTIRGA